MELNTGIRKEATPRDGSSAASAGDLRVDKKDNPADESEEGRVGDRRASPSDRLSTSESQRIRPNVQM